MSHNFALEQGTVLAGDYRIERILGAGGFGITYLAAEPKLARLVAIKEYFPVDFAARNHQDDVVPRSQGSETDYQWGLQRFLEEARTLARFGHPNIVRVHRYFEAKSTGYMVLHYEKGPSLRDWLKALGRHPRQPELDRILAPLLDALEVIHAADFLHRDIAPDNIIIREDASPVLIDFGSARGEVAKHSKAVSALVKPGYSPYEQYATSGRQQGPWTDIYSLGATLYHAIAGRRPLEAPSRMVSDDLKPVREVAQASYRPGFLAAIDHALALDVNERPRSVAAWRKALFAEPPAKGRRGAARAATAGVAAAAPAAGPAADERAAAAPAASPAPAAAAVADGAPPAVPRERRGLFAAFHEGWRQGGTRGSGAAAAPGQPAAAAASVAPVPVPSAAGNGPPAPADATPAPPQPASGLTAAAVPSPGKPVVLAGAIAAAPDAASPPAVVAPAVVPSAAPREMPRAGASAGPAAVAPAGASAPSRRAPPRAIRKPAHRRWRSVAIKLAIGAAIAAAAVAVQDRFPVVQKEGSGTVLSETGAQVPQQGALRGHRGAVLGVAYASDGRHVVSAGEDATVRVWSLATRATVRSWPLDHGPPAAFAAEGRRVLTGHGDGTTVVWDVDSGARVATLREPREAAGSDAPPAAGPPVSAVAFTGDPSLVAVAQGRAITLWDLRGPTQARRLEGHDEPARALAVSSRRGLASGGADRSLRLWSLAEATPARVWRGHAEAVTALTFAPDGRRLASAALDGRIRVTSTMSSRLHQTLRVQSGRITALAFAPAGDILASAGEDGTLRLWDMRRGGRTVRAYQSHTGAINAIAWAPDGRAIAAAGADGTVRLWDAVVR